jgi:HlyD family secretion protein
VRRIEPAGFMKVSALGVEEQRVNVIIDFEEPEDAMLLGDEYRVEVRVVVEERRDVLKVPTSSLFRREDDWAAFVVEGGRAAIRALEIGSNNGLEAEVQSELREGDEVVVHPSEDIVDGARVARRGA